MKNRQAIFLGGIFFLSCINFIYIIWFYGVYRYLPAPFLYDKENTFMDFYNTLYWSGHEGIYDIWKSIYPPLNFLFLGIYQLLFIGEVSEMWDGFAIRNSGVGSIIPLLLIYAACLLISVRVSFKYVTDLKIQFLLFILFLISPAFLFAVERGNLIIICIPLLSWYIFSRNKINRAIAIALLVNLKPYFAVFYIVQLLNKKSNQDNKDFLFLVPVFILIIYLVTGLLINQEFYLMPVNLVGFATNRALFSPTDALSFPSSIAAFTYLRELVIEFSIPPIIGYLSKSLIYLYLLKTLLVIYKYKINFEDLVIFSIILITNYSTSTGGYGILYYLPTLGLIYNQKDYVLLGVIVIGLYLGIWDVVPIYEYSGHNMNVYLSGEMVKIEPFISMGSIIRPIANFAVLVLFFKNLQKRYLYG